LSGRMLQSRVVQASLNAFEERFGQLMLYPRRDWRLSDLCDVFLHPSDLPGSFLWRCRVAGVSYVVPVDPAYPHPPPRNDPWGPATYWRRRQNRKIRNVYERILEHNPSGTLLDVGANWGHHTYPFAATGYRCACFEPQSVCAAFIERVQALNAFHNITVVSCLVGAEPRETVRFFESQVEAFSSTNEQHVASFNQPYISRTVPADTLDAYCSTSNLSPTLIKVDAEGAELDVISGAREIIEQFKPIALIEVSSDADSQCALWERMAGAGYRCYWLSPRTGGQLDSVYVPVRNSTEFVSAGARSVEADDDFVSERDFVFVQSSSDIFSAN
jgi:FkbM family methyltransferase